MDADPQVAALLLARILHVQDTGCQHAHGQLSPLGVLGPLDRHWRRGRDVGRLVNVEELACPVEDAVDVECCELGCLLVIICGGGGGYSWRHGR